MPRRGAGRAADLCGLLPIATSAAQRRGAESLRCIRPAGTRLVKRGGGRGKERERAGHDKAPGCIGSTDAFYPEIVARQMCMQID